MYRSIEIRTVGNWFYFDIENETYRAGTYRHARHMIDCLLGGNLLWTAENAR